MNGSQGRDSPAPRKRSWQGLDFVPPSWGIHDPEDERLHEKTYWQTLPAYDVIALVAVSRHDWPETHDTRGVEAQKPEVFQKTDCPAREGTSDCPYSCG